MAKQVDNPLSDPTRLCQAQPEDVLKWTNGKALLAWRLLSVAVTHNSKTYTIGECNNSICFPGIGLACILGRIRLLTDGKLVAAVNALGDQAPAVKNVDPTQSLCPDIEEAREVSVKMDSAILRQALKEGLLGGN